MVLVGILNAADHAIASAGSVGSVILSNNEGHELLSLVLPPPEVPVFADRFLLLCRNAIAAFSQTAITFDRQYLHFQKLCFHDMNSPFSCFANFSSRLRTCAHHQLQPSSPAAVATDVSALAFTGGSRYLATGGADRLVHVWDLKKRENIRNLAVCVFAHW